jgi:hypothetical protein
MAGLDPATQRAHVGARWILHPKANEILEK